MIAIHRRVVLTLMIFVLAGTDRAWSQQPAIYQASRDTTWLQSLNIFKMYFVRGSDTLGSWVHNLSIERHAWVPGADHRIEFRQLRLNVDRKVDTDTLTLSPAGRVLAINGKTPSASPRGQYDALPRLPDPPRVLRAGDTWHDTIRIEGATTTGQVIFAGTRHYRVSRVLDTLGVRGVLDVTAEGELRYRDGYWADSAAGRTMWIDVSGPMTTRFLFDPAHGRLLGDEWNMHLRGTGGLPNQAGGEDTVPAGLRSSNVERRVSSDRAAALSRSLGTGDTLQSVTSQGGNILVHVGSRRGDTLTVAMARNDGMMGTVRAVVDANGAPRSYQALWTDSSGERHHHIELREHIIHVAGAAKQPQPTVPWTTADYAMDHLLVPLLSSLPADDRARPITIYRPYPGKWETGTARVRSIAGGFLGIVTMEGKDQPDVLILTDQWRLAGVLSQATDTERVPRQGSELYQIVQRLVAGLQN